MGQSTQGQPKRLGVLTSGGDAQGMNAAVRAVVRTALKMGAQPYAILEGWQGAVTGGEMIKPLGWSDVSSVLNKGGTVIGTARCQEFRERSGLRKAAKNLVLQGIDRLISIGGDGSLAGTNEFQEEWPSLLAELVEQGELTPEQIAGHEKLRVAGLVGSIDNDLVGFDMTIGTDSALQRILVALDELSSTAASHRRTFVVEVMGRHCGYLPLMSAVARGCDYVFIPEAPPEDGWQKTLANKLAAGRKAGRRESIVLVAEGAIDHDGNPIAANDVCDALEQETGQRPHLTILGHVQRGGTPSAYDRWMPTALGYAAAYEVLHQDENSEPVIIGARNNRVARLPLMKAVTDTRAVAKFTKAKEYEKAVQARGRSFSEMLAINEVMSTPPEEDQLPADARRVAIMHVGGLAPGMNSAARAAVRQGIDCGFEMLGIYGSFDGLMSGKVKPLAWEDVEGWGFDGGAELGTLRPIPKVEEYYAIGRALEEHHIDALVVIGGYNAYLSINQMRQETSRYPAFNIPMICVPASIDNNLPGSELSIGADSALNNAVWALDRIRESAAASRRCFVADAMGRHCGYLSLMSGIAAGAELVYLDEFPYDLQNLASDVRMMRNSFRDGRRLCLVLHNEEAGGRYDREFIASVFAQESKGLFDVRHSALGHLQQGGEPSPFDRILATRLVRVAIQELSAQFAQNRTEPLGVGLAEKGIETFPLLQMQDKVDQQVRRPLNQWWLPLVDIIPVVSRDEWDVEVRELPVTDL
ncbi:6-phosphofructokinase [Varibaculum vaginae]|uniref:6-phosphofructokinase n=1 Tax=Varibaculum vaginae TaxID=2364797 RepID=UPI000F0961A3|nr:6-phosphofructokinase [Varibaculum vaginae]